MMVAAQARGPLSLPFCLNKGKKCKTVANVDDTSHLSGCFLLTEWVQAVEGAQMVPFHLIIRLLLSQADYVYPQQPLAKSHKTPCSIKVLPPCMMHCIWLVQTLVSYGEECLLYRKFDGKMSLNLFLYSMCFVAADVWMVQYL